MKKLTAIALWTMVLTLAAFAQSKEEREVLKFIADYDQAYVNKDISFAERVWADNYIFSDADGTSQNRARALAEAQTGKANPHPKYKLLSFKSVNDSLYINGNTAMVSGTWTSSTVPINDLQGEPHIDHGRYTMVLEKRNGNWIVIAEHNSEAPHDKKLMETEILKASQEFNQILMRKDRAAFERLFADDFISTFEDGKTHNKAQEIAAMMSPDLKIESVVSADQKVRSIGNNAALETGTYTVTGLSKGKPFTEKARYTTTWIARNGQWQIAADHSSKIEQD
jgi:uncharacterized protein (TIGR02246 family)